MLIKRRLLEKVRLYLEDREFIAIRGPRQSGKTTMLKQLYLELSERHGKNYVLFKTFEDPFELQAFQKSPVDYIKLSIRDDKKYIFLLDEVQYDEEAGKHLKLIYDTIENVKVIMTGSSTLDIGKVSSYLVGRVHLFDLLTLSFDEYLGFVDERLQGAFYKGNAVFTAILNNEMPIMENNIMLDKLNSELEKYIVMGGYPAVCIRQSQEEKIQLLKDIYITYLEKDIPRQYNIKENEVRDLSIALALQAGSLINYNEISAHIGTYYKKIIEMIDALESTYIMKRLRSFSRNLRNEIKKSPKVYFYDLGMRNYLAQNFNYPGLRSGVETGALAENFVFIELQKLTNSNLYFWRTKAGAEVDFVIVNAQNMIPIEVKYSNLKNPEVTRSMLSFIDAYKPKCAIILNKGFIGSTERNDTKIIFLPITYV